MAVLTAADVPCNEYGLIDPDQPVLCGLGSAKTGSDVVRFVGDQVALVVAETEELAEVALALIRVEFEDLPIITDPRQAMTGYIMPFVMLFVFYRMPSGLVLYWTVTNLLTDERLSANSLLSRGRPRDQPGSDSDACATSKAFVLLPESASGRRCGERLWILRISV